MQDEKYSPYSPPGLSISSYTVTVGTRRSPLAKAQVQEVQNELQAYHPEIAFDCLFIDTMGDKDQKTPLRTQDKTDFFTKEIDDLLLSHACRIAIHAAKDLPNPLPQGLSLAALTRGVDPSDALVLKPAISLAALPPLPIIATSSARREEAVRQLIPHAAFIDIRGTIDQRLTVLDSGIADGVVIAEAAILRLRLFHLNRIKLPGTPAPLQGQLAVVIRQDDEEMRSIFSCIDLYRHPL